MLGKFKYVVIDAGGNFNGFIFPAWIDHKTFALKHHYPNCPVIGAGFISVRDGEVICEGRSTSLGIASFPEDPQYFNWLIGK